MKSDNKSVTAKLPQVALDKDTLQDRVYRQLTNLILEGDIAPGQLVTIQALADSLGVSAMPVREAFKRLTAANALTVVSGRSIGIPPLTLDRLSDLRRVRLEIESFTTVWAIDHFTNNGIGVLENEYELMKTAINEQDVKGFLRGNRAFHFEIYRHSGSNVTVGIIENLWLQISPYFRLLAEDGDAALANKHHGDLLQAIKVKDKSAASDSMRADIDDSYAVLSDLL